ncbi:MAG: peptide chain release factor N(5)-glutamine methyltransferase [Lachnospiraceae bacterium]|jgi:release factor glutamine methyltransferase|nr:peptide chain release factor N(5)-glutamine methyltransferase [Lachnospiraceae bacterium]
MDGKLTYDGVYREGAARLGEADIEEAELDARLLLEFVCGTDRNTLLVHGERDVSEEEYGRYCGLIERRAAHVPLQHLTGEQDFMGLTFLVNKDVLVPRQDTEVLVEEAMKHLHDGMRILDLCTGSGCILLSLLHYSNDCEGVGVDLSARALSVAGKNYEIQRTQRPDMKARFLEGNLFEGLEDRFDMIVSNPPYIKTDVIDTLMPEVREYEPVMALDGGTDGLAFYRRIAGDAGAYLNGGGMLFFEIGCEQAADVCKIMEAAGFREVEVVKDFAGLDRVVYGSWFG